MTTKPASQASLPAVGAPRTVFTGGECTVTQTMRGQTTVLTFVGTCSPALREWLPRALRGAGGSVALNLRNLVLPDTPFVREILFAARDLAPRKHVVALIAPSERVVETLKLLEAGERVPILAGEDVIPLTGNFLDQVQREQQELAETLTALETNPLWRRFDRDQAWLCPFCGVLEEEIRIVNLVKPGAHVARGVLRHVRERCVAWRSGNRTPLAASVLDARLRQVNERKAASTAERTQILTRQVAGLQERVESMEDLERDVRKAQRRQLHMLPIDPEPDDAVDMAVAYRPSKAISGDFLDFYRLEGNRFGVAVGDVSGHGVEAAILMGMARKTLAIRVGETAGLREALERVNRDLHAELRSTAFVTAFVGVVDRATRRLVYVRCGHPAPLLRRAAGGCSELGAGGLPLGVDAGVRFAGALQMGEQQLAPGDVLVLYTDGVVEAGYSAQEYGAERLRAAVAAVPADASAERILRAILADLDGFLAGAPQDDDVTLVCLKVK